MPPNSTEIKAPKIALSELPLYQCSCGSELFEEYINLREVSPILSQTGKTEVVPVSVIACVKCLKKYEPAKIAAP